MIALYIIIGIIVGLFLLLSIKANVKLEFDGELRVSVRVLCFNFQIAPAEEPKPVKISDYTFKRHQKRLRENYEKQLKKEAKKQEKKQKKSEAKAKKAEKKRLDKKNKVKQPPQRNILDWIDIARAVIGALFSKFAKRLHIKVARLKIKVATGDAASTAILYGAVSQGVAYILEILQSLTNVDGMKNADISVDVDYLSEETSLDLCFIFSLRVRHVFGIIFGTLGKAIKAFFDTAPPKDVAPSAQQKKQNDKVEINK